MGKSGGNRTAQATSAFLATAERFAPLRRLGWAFLLAWVFCVFYTDAAGGRTGAQAEALAMGMGYTYIYWASRCHVGGSRSRSSWGWSDGWGSPVRHPALFWVAPMATAVSTPLLFCELPDLFATAALFVAGAVLTGFGSGLMWVMWGEYYAKVTQEETEFLAPSSAVLAAVLVLLVSAMDGWGDACGGDGVSAGVGAVLGAFVARCRRGRRGGRVPGAGRAARVRPGA